MNLFLISDGSPTFLALVEKVQQTIEIKTEMQDKFVPELTAEDRVWVTRNIYVNYEEYQIEKLEKEANILNEQIQAHREALIQWRIQLFNEENKIVAMWG